MRVAVHITHEAVQKIGGIGSVIAGLLTSGSYNNFFDRDLLYGPLFNTEGTASSRLGKDGVVLYSGIDNYDTEKYAHIFSPIERKYNIGIVYGKRIIANETNPNNFCESETILVHINNMRTDLIDKFKFVLWENFKIQSDRYDDWDYEQYLRIAVPYTEILSALTSKDDELTHFSHEYMGMASVLKVVAERDKNKKKNDKTVFYAHEVSTARSIVENHPGHDISFYGVLGHKEAEGRSMEELYGDKSGFYRNELVKRTEHIDHIFAVSDIIAKEIKFLNPVINEKKISVVYNGVSLKKITPETKNQSREILQKYCKTLLNYTPDTIFTHVTRLVSSKGLWRDIQLLEKLDDMFTERSMTGFYVLLSTLIGTGRPASDVTRMEKEYGWPILHREGWPDLVGMESDVYSSFSYFNAKSKSIKAVFINQFGFNRHNTGNRVPENAQWIDLRIGSDVELGMSIYEPFGIAQIETVQFGGLAVLSDACGCCGLMKAKYSSNPDSYHIIDFTKNNKKRSVRELLELDKETRIGMEKDAIKRDAVSIFEKIVRINDKNTLNDHVKKSQKLAFEIDWDHIVSKNIIPVLNRL
jgi:glycosyltransferase involved in cell wall biosynthesis